MVKPWKDHRKEITRLYITERMTLADVQKQMKERHNFQASIRSYRQHFDKWDLQKYNCKKRQNRRRREYIASMTLPSPPYTPHPLQSERNGSIVEVLPAATLSHSTSSSPRSNGDHDHVVIKQEGGYGPHTPPSCFADPHPLMDVGYPPMRRDMSTMEGNSPDHRLLPPMVYHSPQEPWLPLAHPATSTPMHHSFPDYGHGRILPPISFDVGC